MVQVNRAHDDALAAYLCNGVTALRPDAPGISLYLMAQTFIGMLDKGFDIAFRTDPNGDEAALAELRRAALTYLETFLQVTITGTCQTADDSETVRDPDPI